MILNAATDCRHRHWRESGFTLALIATGGLDELGWCLRGQVDNQRRFRLNRFARCFSRLQTTTRCAIALRPISQSPKSQHGKRSVPLVPQAIRALHAHWLRALEMRLHACPLWTDYDLVFPTELGEPLRALRVRDHFARIAKRAAIMDATPHALRHSTGTFLLAAGVPDRIVQAILGHGSAAMTRHYEHVPPTVLGDAGARLAEFLAATS